MLLEDPDPKNPELDRRATPLHSYALALVVSHSFVLGRETSPHAHVYRESLKKRSSTKRAEKRCRSMISEACHIRDQVPRIRGSAKSTNFSGLKPTPLRVKPIRPVRYLIGMNDPCETHE